MARSPSADADFATVTDRAVVHDGGCRIERLRFSHRKLDGSRSAEIEREIFAGAPAASALLYDPARDRLVFIEQFRIAAHVVSAADPKFRFAAPLALEVVGGVIEDGETAEEAARKEALEETGCRVSRLEPVAAYMVSPGNSTQVIELFCGRVDAGEAFASGGNDAEHEDIRVVVATPEEAFRWLDAGRFASSSAIIALLWFRENRARLRHAWREQAP
jgi:ADP-ribose pyrophosphatase